MAFLLAVNDLSDNHHSPFLRLELILLKDDRGALDVIERLSLSLPTSIQHSCNSL